MIQEELKGLCPSDFADIYGLHVEKNTDGFALMITDDVDKEKVFSWLAENSFVEGKTFDFGYLKTKSIAGKRQRTFYPADHNGFVDEVRRVLNEDDRVFYRSFEDEKKELLYAIGKAEERCDIEEAFALFDRYYDEDGYYLDNKQMILSEAEIESNFYSFDFEGITYRYCINFSEENFN